MPEKIIVRQDSNYETEILGPDPNNPESQKLQPTRNIYDLTPYGMLLASLGSCTAALLNSYAQNHGLELQGLELRLRYERNFKKDCQNCEGIDRYEEEIDEEISLSGNLTGKEREKLFLISHHCPIHKMLKSGIMVNSQLAKNSD
jgi:putative redox protein